LAGHELSMGSLGQLMGWTGCFPNRLAFDGEQR
jgi:hypothetical protein